MFFTIFHKFFRTFHREISDFQQFFLRFSIEHGSNLPTPPSVSCRKPIGKFGNLRALLQFLQLLQLSNTAVPFTVLHHIGSTTLTVGSSGASLTVGASADLSLGMPKRNHNKSQKLKKCPWNKGRKIAKTHKQHVFIPREQLELFFAVALWFAGPVYAVALWLCLVTSRRISETLLLRGCDVMLHGGPDSDHPHIIYIQRPEDEGRQGNGKLGGERIVARVSQDVVETIEEIQAQGLHRNILPILEPYRTSHQKLFDQKPQRKDAFQFPEGNKYIFPAQTAKFRKSR
jgi:hypothetical protein